MESSDTSLLGGPTHDQIQKLAELVVQRILSFLDESQLRSLAHFVVTGDAENLVLPDEADRILLTWDDSHIVCHIHAEYVDSVVTELTARELKNSQDTLTLGDLFTPKQEKLELFTHLGRSADNAVIFPDI